MPPRGWRLRVEDILKAGARIERYVEGLTFKMVLPQAMRIAASIPDRLSAKLDHLARLSGRSRSELVSAALEEYVARHASDEVTQAMDRVCAEVGDQRDGFINAAGRRVLETTEW